MQDISTVISRLTKNEHGFKHIVEAGNELLRDSDLDHFDLAKQLIANETYQARMLGAYLLGSISPENACAFEILKNEVAKDENWRVQEMLAKAFDFYAKIKGYENSLPEIRDWLSDENPNVVRAVTEGLRIWTSRPYFKEHPKTAIALLVENKNHESAYVRKSVGNALRDITRKHSDLVRKETESWDLKNSKVAFTYKLIFKKRKSTVKK